MHRFKSYLEYLSTKDNRVIIECQKYNKNHKKHFIKDLIKRFASIHEFCEVLLNVKKRFSSIQIPG